MTNREAYKDELDEMLVGIIALVKGKPVLCEITDCNKCDIQEMCGQGKYRGHVFDWLNAEYQEPPVDWNKVPIDTPVLASDSKEKWTRRYFAGIDENGALLAFPMGCTSWTSEGKVHWQYMKLAEGNE